MRDFLESEAEAAMGPMEAEAESAVDKPVVVPPSDGGQAVTVDAEAAMRPVVVPLSDGEWAVVSMRGCPMLAAVVVPLSDGE